MKHLLSSLFLIFITFQFLHAQNDTPEELPTKKGWSFGILPAITYNTDLGFQYGGLIDLYNYGDGTLYPKYYERYYLEISRYTKGSGINNFSYESNKLIPGNTILFDINYQPDEQFDFLGVNGYESVYNPDWEELGNEAYKSKMFYKNQTKRLKIKLDIVHPINEKWNWLVGLEYYHYNVNSLDVAKYNDNRDEDEKIPAIDAMPGLWDRYVEWGLIEANNAKGGSFLGIKSGIIFDTRDNWTNASKGVWSEAVLVWVPDFIGNSNSSYLKLNLTHRQYFTMVKDKVTFAYRVGYTGNIFGDEPYFSLPIMYSAMLKGSVEDGLGGRKTLRGIRRNRVIGDGEAYANGEFRYKFVKFNWFNQHWYVATNIFLDAGKVVQLLPLKNKVLEINQEKPLSDYSEWGQYAIGFDADGNPNGDTLDDYFNFGGEKLHASYGIGLRISMNENFVVGIDYGRAMNSQDGDSGLYIGLNYIF